MTKTEKICAVLIAVLIIIVSPPSANADVDCDRAESGWTESICELKKLKENPPNVFQAACDLWISLSEIDRIMGSPNPYGAIAQDANMSREEMQRLVDEAADQFGAYAIGILQMRREVKRYKTCGTGKWEFYWANGFDIADRIDASKAQVTQTVFKAALLADVNRHMNELHTALSDGSLPKETVLPCVASILDNASRYQILVSTEKWDTAESVEAAQKDPSRICDIEASVHLRPR